MYPESLIAPIEAELTDIGFVALKQSTEVTEHFYNHQGTTLLVINSICGCAGPSARLGVTKALEQVLKKPDITHVFNPSVIDIIYHTSEKVENDGNGNQDRNDEQICSFVNELFQVLAFPFKSEPNPVDIDNIHC